MSRETRTASRPFIPEVSIEKGRKMKDDGLLAERMIDYLDDTDPGDRMALMGRLQDKEDQARATGDIILADFLQLVWKWIESRYELP